MDKENWTMSVQEAGKEAGMSKNSAYRAAARGEIPTIASRAARMSITTSIFG
jgi:hypothetical protein